MNLWLILVGRPGPPNGRNAAGKAQRPTVAIGGRFRPNPFLKDALPEVGFGVKVRPMLPLSPEWIADADLTRLWFYCDSVPAEIRPVRAKFAAEQFHARIAPNNAMTLSRIDWL